MLEDALDWLDEQDRADQASELFLIESEYMKQKLEAEDEANRLPALSLEQSG